MRKNIAAVVSVLFTSFGVADAAEVVLNEYNAVSAGQILEDDGTDTYWGRVEGNGGDWFEMVVIADHLDMRNWQLIINDNSGQDPITLTLSGHDVWSDLRSGTIITVSEELGNNVDDYNPELGQWWLNVKASDESNGTYITASDFRVNNDDWQLTITNDAGSVVFGPAGEGIMPFTGVGGQEVCKLEENPSTAVTEASNYDAGQSSTFGSPNIWEGGLHAQSFSALRDVLDQDTGSGDVDECPADPNKTAPGVCGCSVPDTDSDGDGTPDCNDSCPTDPDKTVPGQCGCGNANTDSDGDGTADCNDDCPADPNKTVVGLCGCGTLESDSDEDGAPDCDDGCPADPNKFVSGVCGCGQPDQDRDGDDILDCDDGCPNDSGKSEPGVCGCGVVDEDSDGDSVFDCVDECPSTEIGTEVGSGGCPIDNSAGRQNSSGSGSLYGPCGAIGMFSWAVLLLGFSGLRALVQRFCPPP